MLLNLKISGVSPTAEKEKTTKINKRRINSAANYRTRKWVKSFECKNIEQCNFSHIPKNSSDGFRFDCVIKLFSWVSQMNGKSGNIFGVILKSILWMVLGRFWVGFRPVTILIKFIFLINFRLSHKVQMKIGWVSDGEGFSSTYLALMLSYPKILWFTLTSWNGRRMWFYRHNLYTVFITCISTYCKHIE